MSPTTLARALIVAWLTFVWVMLWGDVSVGNVLAGLVLGTLLVVAFPPHGTRGSGVHPVAVIRFGAYFLWLLVVATATVVATVLRPRLRLEQGIVAVPMRAASPVVVSFVANAISLTPGTLTVDVRPRSFGIDTEAGDASGAAPTLFVHCLIVGDPDQVRADIAKIEDHAVRAFGTDADRAAMASRQVRS